MTDEATGGVADAAFAARLDLAVADLSAADPDLGALIAEIGPCLLAHQPGEPPFRALVRSIAHQQVHARAAEAILKRLIDDVGEGAFPTAEALIAADDARLRAAGFSSAKAAALRDVAAKTLAGVVPSRREAEALADDALVARLIAVRGIGRWTVEMLLIFSLGRLDVFPYDDFGVQSGLRRLRRLPDDLPKRALRAAMEAAAESWRPWRSVASWYLWRLAERARAERG